LEVVLTISYSDSGSGSGIQADLKTFEAFEVYGVCVTTAIVAQNTNGILKALPAPADIIKAQLDAVFADFDIKAVKIGMLFNKETINEVKNYLKDKSIPIILDPIAINKNKTKILCDGAINELQELFELSTLITPNSHEFKEFFKDLGSARAFTKEHQNNILIKDLTDKTTGKSIDVLIKEDSVKNFQTQKVNSKHTYGTGSALSSAIASLIALGKPMDEAIFLAKKFVYSAITFAPELGSGEGPINFKKAYEEIYQYL